MVAPAMKEGEEGGGKGGGRDSPHCGSLIRRKMAEMHKVFCYNRLCKALELSRLRIESVDQLPE